MECYWQYIYYFKSEFPYVSAQVLMKGNKYENNYNDMSDQAGN